MGSSRMMDSTKRIFFVSFFVGMVLWLAVRIGLLHYIHIPERSIWQAKAEMIENYTYKQDDIVVIGSSRALAINPEQLRQRNQVNAYNFSVTGATTPSTYFFLKRILRNNTGIEKVYLEFSPMNLTHQDTALDASLGENFVRYVATEDEAAELDADMPGALKKYREIHNFPYNNFVNIKDMSLLEGVLIRWRTGKTDQKEKRNLQRHKGYFPYADIDMSSHKNITSFNDKIDLYYKRSTLLTDQLPPVTAIYFDKIVNLLNTRRIDYIIFFAPVQVKSLNYKNMGMGATYQLIRKAGKNHINDNVPLFDNSFFHDPSHVSAKGSEIFTTFFYDCVVSNNCVERNISKLYNY